MTMNSDPGAEDLRAALRRMELRLGAMEKRLMLLEKARPGACAAGEGFARVAGVGAEKQTVPPTVGPVVVTGGEEGATYEGLPRRCSSGLWRRQGGIVKNAGGWDDGCSAGHGRCRWVTGRQRRLPRGI